MDEHVSANFDEVRWPNTFYCTFENSKAYQNMVKIRRIEVGENVIDVKRAKDPTDILWENKGLSKSKRICRGVLLLGLLFPFMLIETYTTFVKGLDW